MLQRLRARSYPQQQQRRYMRLRCTHERGYPRQRVYRSVLVAPQTAWRPRARP